MIDPISIWKKDRETYYDFSTKKFTSVWPRYVFLISTSIFFAIFLGYPSGDFLQTLVSALAILLGFSFGAQFVLVDRSFVPQSTIDSIEDNSLKRKIEKLARELFDNISFFNLMCLAGIAVACALLLAFEIPNIIATHFSDQIQLKITVGNQILGKFFLFFFLGETCWSFLRLLGRINYLFQKIRGRPSITETGN